MYLKTISEGEATGRVAELYAEERAQLGFVAESTKSWTTRADLLPAFTAFIDQVRSGSSLSAREWALVSLIAAKHVPSTYCSYVYGKRLVGHLGSKEAVAAVHRDFRSAGLTDKEVAMLSYAELIARKPSEITAHHVDRLRAMEFDDREICDIALCASFRCFVSRYFEAVGASPDPDVIDEDPVFRASLTVGRPPSGIIECLGD
jgi:uncharacterized peroxidase-related enzyme